jgi:hypothetical protein
MSFLCASSSVNSAGVTLVQYRFLLGEAKGNDAAADALSLLTAIAIALFLPNSKEIPERICASFFKPPFSMNGNPLLTITVSHG